MATATPAAAATAAIDDDSDLDTLNDSDLDEDELPHTAGSGDGPVTRGRARTIDDYFQLMGGRLRIPKPKFWLRRGRALTETAEQSLKIAGFRADPDATVEDLEPLACAKDGLEKIIVTLEQKNFYQPTDGARFAIASLAEAIENTDELFVKGYVLLKLNTFGQEQERALILTDRAYYTGHYSYVKGRLTQVKRHDLANFKSVRFGPVAPPAGATKKKPGWVCVVKMLDRQPTAMKKLMEVPVKERGKAVGYSYTRGFRPRPEVPGSEQHELMAELAWAIFAVANRLTVEILAKPREHKMTHDSSQVRTIWSAAYNLLGMGVTSDDKVVHAKDPRDIRKAEEERRANRFGSLRRKPKDEAKDKRVLPPEMRPGAAEVDAGVGNVPDDMKSEQSTTSSLRPGMLLGEMTGRGGSLRSKREMPELVAPSNTGTGGSTGSRRRQRSKRAAAGSDKGSQGSRK